MNGPHSVTAPGPCLQNNSVFAPRRYHENIGQGEMRWRVLLLYSWRPVARDLTSVKVCMLPAYNYPLPGLSLFVCRLNTIMETLNRVWQTPWYKQDRVTGKTVNSRHYQREEGETEYLSLTAHSAVFITHGCWEGGGGWENMFLFTSRQSGGES